MTDYSFDWADLAFGSKKPVNELKAIFIAAPRELSAQRFTQLIKEYLPQGNIVLGIAKELYVDDFDDQPQFKTLQVKQMQGIIDKVNAAPVAPHAIYTLHYLQRETPYLLQKLHFKKVVFVNGSWHRSLHLRPEYYILANNHTPYETVSPFANEQEAKNYAKKCDVAGAKMLADYQAGIKTYTDAALVQLVKKAATLSFDYTHQTGVALAKKRGDGTHKLLTTAFNRVVPYQTYAMQHGSEREKHFSPAHDLNFYDTVHAETELLIKVQKQKLDLRGTSLFINLLPCPTCARMLAETDIDELVYQEDHSDGYAARLLTEAGKQVRRVL
jgi:deoxycytidylate deaminase